MAMAVTPPAAADKVVETAVLATTASEPIIANCDPGLKPYHPTQRINVPKTTNEALCPGISDDATIRAESASSRAYDHSTHQTGDATSHVNDTRAGEVIHTTVKEFIVVFERCEPSISIPDPVNDDWVDERGEKERVAQIGLECRSFRDGT